MSTPAALPDQPLSARVLQILSVVLDLDYTQPANQEVLQALFTRNEWLSLFTHYAVDHGRQPDQAFADQFPALVTQGLFAMAADQGPLASVMGLLVKLDLATPQQLRLLLPEAAQGAP